METQSSSRMGRRLSSPMRASGRYRLPTGDFVRAEGAPIDGEVADRSTGADVRCVGKIGTDVDRRRVTEIDRMVELRLADALAVDVERHGRIAPGGGDLLLLAGRPVVDLHADVVLHARRIMDDEAQVVEVLHDLQRVLP